MKKSEGRPSLDTALRAMAEDEAQLGASAAIEARLLAEVRSIATARRRRMAIAASAAADNHSLRGVAPAFERIGNRARGQGAERGLNVRTAARGASKTRA